MERTQLESFRDYCENECIATDEVEFNGGIVITAFICGRPVSECVFDKDGNLTEQNVFGM